MGKKKNVVLPPQLPPDIAEEEVQVSDEDLQFVKENRDYAGFVNTLDTQSITRCFLYEKRIKKKSLEKSTEENKLEVDPVDALPVKTLDGKIYYRTVPKESRTSDAPKEDEAAKDSGDDNADKSTVKLTKSERRAKLKKSKKEAKKQAKEPAQILEEVQENPQAEVLAEVKEDLTAEEVFAGKKSKLAEYSFALLADPVSNMKFLNEILQICKDEDHNIVKDGLLSLMLVYKDIIPGYRIRLPTEKELEMTVSKEVQKMRCYESTLLSEYKAYLQKLVTLEKQRLVKHASVFCMCHLVDAVPHFNFRVSLLAAVIKNISSPDDFIRKLCCKTVKSLLADEGKHGGEATVEAVQLIADYVRTRACQLHPDSIEDQMAPVDHGKTTSKGYNFGKIQLQNVRQRKYSYPYPVKFQPHLEILWGNFHEHPEYTDFIDPTADEWEFIHENDDEDSDNNLEDDFFLNLQNAWILQEDNNNNDWADNDWADDDLLQND
ncbi:hypothetical protein HHK36_026166 [Tetracentron sinense]|uniref:Nucleolar complex-associated protein 3 N-terminal domain-containing protein n=1 Tax=Tetracentron sinense TaxID=13715 RepID=A0A834YLU7_TETSI|nr:hypothetical protein HHK36_026166 [Tetracentron sinense]